MSGWRYDSERGLRVRTLGLQCVVCSRWTSEIEATLRIFNTGLCAECGGQLKKVELAERPVTNAWLETPWVLKR